MKQQPETLTPLTAREVPPLLAMQLAEFSMESIHAHQVMEFYPRQALERLEALEGRQVIGADFGGDKGVTKLFTVTGGQLVISDQYEDYVQGSHGDGYLESLEKTARFVAERDIPVGISWGAPLEGTRPLDHPKAVNFLGGLRQKYQGDFAKLLPTLRSCINDGPAGVISGAIEANRSHAATAVLLPINGGGLGMAVIADGKVYATEAGHVEAVDELNSYGQAAACGVFEAKYLCLEHLGANKAGIEAQWQQLTGHHLPAKEIEDRYKAGDNLAAELYDHSALVVAHMVQGTARAFNIDLSSELSLVVGHGGAFKFPQYGERVRQILSAATAGDVKLIMTKDYGDPQSNACLDGAAIAALTATRYRKD